MSFSLSALCSVSFSLSSVCSVLFSQWSMQCVLFSQCSLQSCLLNFVKSEVVADVECPRCSQVEWLLPFSCCEMVSVSVQAAGHSVKQTFMKRLQLARAPLCLCLHLQRTVWLPSGSLYKNTISVSFPSQLNLDTFIKTRSVLTKYSYCSTVSLYSHSHIFCILHTQAEGRATS